ncbi:fungal-specific transcription factor domain-containing protein [Pisolithus marmoratus]|nr:fungal-specific transcription factor domain-containing protein [Pisolithus marmoratus]
MSERIRQLEDALSELQAKHSMEPHPLLRPDLLGASQRDDDVGDNLAIVEETPELVEALGTLSVSEGGASRFFGPTGGSQCLLMIEYKPSQDFTDGSPDLTRDSNSPGLPPEIEIFGPAFPFKPAHSTLEVKDLVNDYLPDWERARYLAEVYLGQEVSLFQSVSGDDILTKLLPAYYTNGVPHVTQAENNAHRLGLLFLIFAIGALLDPNQEPGNTEAERYHQLAYAAICLQSVIEQPSLETIQALHLLSVYNAVSGNELAGKETSTETSWSLVTLAAHLAHTLGLHRNGLRWGLSPDIATKQRVVFWDLFVADVWNCLEAGRPPTFSLPYIDCEFPRGGSPHDKVHIGSDSQSFFESWVYRFASICVADVAARTLSADPPSYSTILELDSKVSNFPVTEAAEEFAAAARGAVPAKPADENIEESMLRLMMSNAREVILLYIHRSYFVQAITENPINPLNSPYTPSFLAARRASLTILRTVKMQYDLHPELTARLWPLWTYAFSAAFVFGTIVTRGPRSSMASEAMKELHDAYHLFSNASSHSRRAQKALPIITKLRGKAHNALHNAQSDMPHELGQQWGVTENEGDDAVDIFAGRVKKIVSMKRQTPDGMSERSPNSDGSARESSSPTLMSPPKQSQIEHVALQPYSCEQLGSSWLQQPGSVAGLERTQEIPTWGQTLYPDASFQSTLMQLPPTARQIPSHVPSQVSVRGGPSTSGWLAESSDPYPMANLSASSVHAHSQGCHRYQDRYDHDGHCRSTTAMSSTVPYYGDTLVSASAHHHQSRPQPQPSTHHTHGQSHPRGLIQPHSFQHQPTPSHLPQYQPIPLSPSELTQFGLVAPESGPDQRWTSFLRESGCFDGYDYRG